MNRVKVLLMCTLICSTIQAQNVKEYYDVASTESRIQELVDVIQENLHGTSVLDDFIQEQSLWREYCNAYIRTRFPECINGVKMEWGSILGYEVSQEILRMNIERIGVLEAYINSSNETGTDGSGRFKEYLKELEFINNREK